MANEIWQQEEQKFLHAIKDIKIPNKILRDVAFITPKVPSDLETIPDGGGCYWIWTTEPVLHSLHKNKTPVGFENGEIIYNGIAKDDVRGRVQHHLFGHLDAGWSGISLDIHFGETTSHRKKAFSAEGKVPFIKEKIVAKRESKKNRYSKGDLIDYFKPIRTKEDFSKMYLSDEEKSKIADADIEKIFFRNGINLTESKHSKFEFRVYFITKLTSLYLEFIEKNWRNKYGLPKLCSYKSGR